jgi:hypothetical protein
MTIADSAGMKADASRVQRVRQATDDNRDLDSQAMRESPDDSERGNAMNRRDETPNRVEALLRAHPSIVHEID